jgi:hypothetical protein
VLGTAAAHLRAATFETPQARALVAGIAAAAERVVDANQRFVGQAAGTPAQWQEWAEAVSGPASQVQVAAKGFGKCPS